MINGEVHESTFLERAASGGFGRSCWWVAVLVRLWPCQRGVVRVRGSAHFAASNFGGKLEEKTLMNGFKGAGAINSTACTGELIVMGFIDRSAGLKGAEEINSLWL